MSQQLLVPVKSRDKVEDLLPYLEDIARPGMKIIFLVHFGASRFAELAGRLLEIQTGLPGTLYSDTVVPQSHVTGRIEQASRELCKHSVQIEVKFYSGRLQPILRQCIEYDNQHTVIMRRGRQPAWRWLGGLLSKFQLTKPLPAMPVVLFHPSNLSRR